MGIRGWLIPFLNKTKRLVKVNEQLFVQNVMYVIWDLKGLSEVLKPRGTSTLLTKFFLCGHMFQR